MKKTLMISLSLLFVFLVAACTTPLYTVSFDTDGGSAVAAQEVYEGELATEPAAPTKDATGGDVYTFLGWFTDAAATMAFDFSTPIEEDLTLYAGWTLNVALSFETKTDEEIAPVLLGLSGGTAQAPAEPTREGYRFGGWFYGKPGLTWLETTPVSFPLDVTESTTLYAYWEPIDSAAINYSEGETYITSLDSSSRLILNPMVYEWSHENEYINLMTTSMYETEVDWDKAIEDGIADFPGDFSKFISKEYSIEALDFVYILGGATRYPIDSQGEEHLDENGNYNRDAASTIKDTEWTFNIREDLVFQDGTPITADTYEYTLKMFLDPALLNFRGNLYYKDDENTQGLPILGAKEYFTQTDENGDPATVSWDSVGFEKISDYSFKLTFWEPVSQSSAVGFGGIDLVHPAQFEASLDATRTNAAYGTPAYPFMSYGEYVLKSWDENQKLVFNKNYDYVLRGTINYKSMVVQIVDNVDQRMELFEAGDLTVVGLTQDYYAEYAENPNVYKTWGGYPQYLMINLAKSKVEDENGDPTDQTVIHPDIMYDIRFREALFFGFDRNYYANNVYAPNTASVLPIPLDTKVYNQDALYYSESPQHLENLETFGINPETSGYNQTRAVELFEAAYSDWVAAGNTGPVQIRLATDNDEFSLDLATYIEGHFETLFGADKFDLVLDQRDPTAHREALSNWNFDLSLNSIGFGSSTGAQWQYGAIVYLGGLLAPSLGLTDPFYDDEDGYGDYLDIVLDIDLTATYNYLNELGEDFFAEGTDNELTGHLELYNALKESTDPDTLEVKPAGIYAGTVYDLAMLMYTLDTPFDAVTSEPFAGATQDAWNIIQALEYVYYENMLSIPTVTRSSATLYADNVVITWPAYSSAFGWGSQRYRYLNTDPDFM